MVRRLALVRLAAATALLVMAVPAARAFPPFPPVKLPPVKLPPSPVLKALFPYLPDTYYPSNPPPTAKHESATSLLKAALKDVREVRRDLADKDHLHLTEAGQKVKAAEQLVVKESKVAHADKKVKRSAELDAVVKDMEEARRHISDHQVDRARTALKEAENGLVELTGGKPAKKDAKKEPKK
jgi:hypothetical protein